MLNEPSRLSRESERRALMLGLMFTAPWLIGLSVFLLYPLSLAVYYSFTDYSVLLPPVYVGFDNYRELFGDPLFWRSLYNTTVFAVGSLGLSLFVSLLLALLLNARIRFISLYRTLFFLPTLVPIVASSILWMGMYNGENGIINALLAVVGVQGPAWLTDPDWVKTAIIIMAAWGAGHTMVILLAGLQDIPESLYEAAVLDGANWFQRLIHVTLPALSPVIFFNVVMGIIGGFQVFTQGIVMTTDAAGNQQRAALFYVMQLFNVGFQDLRMGYACAMAFVLFVIILLLTLITMRLSRDWVSYER
jgi:multiple sugar transport system permease protein